MINKYSKINLLFKGLENFENKIHKVANGGEKSEKLNWIEDIFDKFNTNDDMAMNNVFEGVPGLEPPMLDETWGLKDYNQNKTHDNENAVDKYRKDIEGTYTFVHIP